MSRTLFFLVAAAVSLAWVLPAPVAAQSKPRVAVLNFEYEGVRAAAAAALKTDQDVGAGVADILIQELVKGGHFAVVERNALDAVLKEQNFSNSDRADPATAARIGRVLGADAIIVGSVTQFAVQETTGAGGSLSRLTRGALSGVQRNSSKAMVGIHARLVNTSTAEIMTAATGTGESSGSSTSVSAAATVAPLDMTSSAFGSSFIGTAVNRAVNSVAAQLNGVGQKIATTRVNYSGVIADVSGKALIVNVGKKGGVQVGDRLEISRVVRSVTDPQDPTKILRTISEKVATAAVTEADDVSATATVDGDSVVKVGDAIKRAPRAPSSVAESKN
jgi:curli biogenesis system outer membrane secretion channel CsgG